MLDTMKYINHLGETIQFGSKYYANYNDLRDYTWKYDTEYERAVNFRRTIVKKSLPIIIKGATVSESLILKNSFYTTVEKDVTAFLPGKIYIGDYYMECFIYENKKGDYLIDKTYMTINVSVVSNTGLWVKEISKDFIYSEGGATPGEATKDYEYLYEYDYALASSSEYGGKITNTHFNAVDWTMTINSGNAGTDVEITIGSDLHKFTYTIPTGGYVKINSKEKTMTAVAANGTQTNIFNTRDKTNNIFKKIEPGFNTVSWNGAYNFNITLMVERGEPEWT
jgi:hypothetical protein